jgi:hypothetical protein
MFAIDAMQVVTSKAYDIIEFAVAFDEKYVGLCLVFVCLFVC